MKLLKFTEYFNEHFNIENNISTKINNLINDYHENIGCSVNQINRGYCDEFAEDLLLDVGGESNNVFLLATNPDYSEDYAIDFFNQNDKRYYKKFTKYGIEVENVMKLDHVWLYYNGKHYDAETIYGVDDFINLPFFQRIKKKIKLYNSA